MFTHDRRLVVGAGCGLSIFMYPATAISLLAAIFIAQRLRGRSHLFRFTPYLVLSVIIVKNSIVTDPSLFVGVSFGLFQLCYYLDEKLSISRTFSQLSFFPQLACGPVVRPHNYERRRRINDPQQLLYHIVFLHGLLLKCYISFVFETMHETEMGILTGINFIFYLYADYLGWSLMGISIAGLAGFKLPMNFKRPFATSTISEFWSSWNITLYRWTHSFIRLPRRVVRVFPYSTIFSYTTVLAIWHGMSLNFLGFGIFNLAMFSIQRHLKRMRMNRSSLLIQGVFHLTMGAVFVGMIPETVLPNVEAINFLYFILAVVILLFSDSLNPVKFKDHFTKYARLGCVSLPALVVVITLIHPESTVFYYARF